MAGVQRKRGALLLGLGAILLLAIGAAGVSGLRVNLTPSYPRGLWRIEPKASYENGDIVFVCAPQTSAFSLASGRGYLPRGLCAGWTAPLIKGIVATAGQEVSIDHGIRVDGIPVSNSTVQERDASGLPLSAATGGVVAHGDVFLLAPHPYSFDSRYFGPVPATGILGLARPVLVNDD